MRRFFVTGTFGVAFGLCVGIGQVGGQAIPKSLQQGGPEDVLKQRQNNWTVGLAGGAYDGTYLRFADELGKVLDDGDQLRVLPIITHGAAANLEDLLYLRGVDIAFTQSDVFEYFRTERKTPHLEDRIRYIIRLPVAELHVTVRANIQTLEDLRGQKVMFGPPGSSPTLTGPIIFQRLGIPVEPVFVDFTSGMKMLRSGEVAGLLGVVSKPVDYWLKIPSNAGLKLLPVPYSKAFADLYAVGEFTNADYPNLIPPGQRIDTIAVPSVLAVYNWPKNSDRYRRVERFIQYLFNRWDKLSQPPFHPRWRDVNLAATVPGWTRFSVAEEMLQRPAQGSSESDQAMARDFQTYMSREVRAAPRSDAELDALFRRFVIWREQQHKQ
ncbi:MAG TPA: TAXI family TRAP transporter solute-binding subunit [Xanthobacteraceae bacterium]|nr:TAXI family TRAP transporter solute-binding subunit [Xanthobacteraceae bacterium]